MTDKLAAAEESQWRNLEQQTGRSQAQWIELTQAKGLAKHGEIVAWLKQEFGIGHGYANLVAIRAREAAAGGAPAEEDLVAAQYSGAKAALRPVYETLISVVQAFGKDVEVAPKKTYVSLRRSKQFALVQPSTATRLDLGLNLKGVAPAGRLERSGSFNAMCSHRVRIEAAADIDGDVRKWLRQAYDAA
jgi:hypothetical protein